MMNPLHPSTDEFFFLDFSSASYSIPILTTPEDQILHDPLVDGTGDLPRTSQMGKGKRREQLSKIATDENKKWIHKETERQRRQEMAKNCATLRSLLPFEYVKGNRSISDHMYEAVNYINQLQNKVKQLQTKKDELMKLCDLGPTGPENGSFAAHLPTHVIVHPFPGGVEIKCSYSFRKCVFPLSRVLDMLLEEGLNVVSCTSTKTDDRFIHTIRSEDQHMNGTDYSELQRKLTEAISSSSLQETV